MSSKTIQQFKEFLNYALTLKNDHSGIVIAPGKWTVKEVICHLWNWDKYSLEVMAPRMEDNAQLPEFVDHDSHNAIAIELAKTFEDMKSLIQSFINTRMELIEALESKSNISFTIGQGKRKFTTDSYIKIFVIHDEHHKNQIDQVI